jgi:hypothetical protein
MAMLADEPRAETTTQAPQGLASNVIVAPGAAGAILEPVRSEADCGPHESEAVGPGLDGEETVWEGHYSFKNFLGRALLGALFTLIWLWLAVSTWGMGRGIGGFWTTALGLVLLAYWGFQAYKFLRAYRGHHYRLTTRRLFLTTGFFQRRVDQLELLRINDVYIQQSMIGDFLKIGNVVVISSEQTLPKAYLLGIDDPRQVMDLIWHYMRIEQSQKTNRVNPV